MAILAFQAAFRNRQYSLVWPVVPVKFKQQRKVGHKVGNNIRAGITFESVTAIFDDKDFVGAFRMSRACFEKLVNKAAQVWKKSDLAGRRSKRGTIPVDI